LPSRSRRYPHVIDPGALVHDIQSGVANYPAGFANDEVMDVAAENQLVMPRGVGKLTLAFGRVLNRTGGRFASSGTWVDAHPVRLPAILKAETLKLRPKRILGSHRPASDLSRTRLASDLDSAAKIAVAPWK
jgi:hypothetical protein